MRSFSDMREDVIGDLEARFGGVPVDGGDVFEEVVASLLHGLAGCDDVLAGDRDGQLGAVVLCVGGEVGEGLDGSVLRDARRRRLRCR